VIPEAVQEVRPRSSERRKRPEMPEKALWSGSSAADIARSTGCCSSRFVRKANWANSGAPGEPFGTVKLQADGAEPIVGPFNGAAVGCRRSHLFPFPPIS